MPHAVLLEVNGQTKLGKAALREQIGLRQMTSSVEKVKTSAHDYKVLSVKIKSFTVHRSAFIFSE